MNRLQTFSFRRVKITRLFDAKKNPWPPECVRGTSTLLMQRKKSEHVLDYLYWAGCMQNCETESEAPWF